MKVIMPKEFQIAINEMPANKTVKKNAIKIYAALYLKQSLKNSHGYFPISSDYMKSINVRYYKILDYFIERGLIDFYKKEYEDPNDLFGTIYRKSYNREKGICSKYKFLVNTNTGIEVQVDMVANRQHRWYELITDSLIEAGLEVKISRDSYGRRVHHSAIREYKNDFKGYYTIDSICSQPRLLYLHLKQKGINDFEYNRIFDNGLDFYSEVAHKLHLESRDDAKELFMYWVNGEKYIANIANLFKYVNEFLKKSKLGNYKNGGSLLQRIESKIWIDNILNDIPCDFALPIHDCVIVKESDVDRVLEYCQHKYPELRFKKEKIK